MAQIKIIENHFVSDGKGGAMEVIATAKSRAFNRGVASSDLASHMALNTALDSFINEVFHGKQ